jgi:hypothetical protein
VVVTGGECISYSTRTPDFTPVFNEVRIAQSFVFCLVFCRSLFVYLPFFLLIIVFSVLPFTTSGYPLLVSSNLINRFRQQEY